MENKSWVESKRKIKNGIGVIMEKYKKQDLILYIFFGIQFLFLFIAMQYTELDFDAGMNFQISANLAENGTYQSSYIDNGYNGTDNTMFDHKIQTGSTVIIPTALLNLISGIKTQNMQFIILMYFGILLFFILKMVSKESGLLWGILAVLIFVPKTVMNVFAGYGEMVTAMYMVICFYLFSIAYQKKRMVWYYITGFAFGLGYLTKTIFLITIVPFAAIFLYEVIIKRKKEMLMAYFYIALGALTSVGLLEIYKLFSLGLHGYKEWWIWELHLILGEAGVSNSLEEKISIFSKAKTNLMAYASCYGMNIIVVIGIYIITGISSFFQWWKDKSKTIYISIYIISITYFLWWIFLLPASRLWERRDIIGHTFILFLAIMYIGKLINLIQKRYKTFGKLLKIGVTLSLIIFIFKENQGLVSNIKANYKQKENTIEVVKVLEQLPENATLYGTGWWQNPVLAVKSGRKMENLQETIKIETDSYFVEDFYMKALSPNTIIQVQSEYYLEKVFENSGNAIYKMSNNREEQIRQSGNYIELEIAQPFYGYIQAVSGANIETVLGTWEDEVILIPINCSNLIEIKFKDYLSDSIQISKCTIVENGNKKEIFMDILKEDELLIINAKMEKEENNRYVKLIPEEKGNIEIKLLTKETDKENYKLGQKILFQEAKNNFYAVVESGLSFSETEYTWSDSKDVIFNFYIKDIEQNEKVFLNFIIQGYTNKSVKAQNIDIYINEKKISSIEVAEKQKFSINIPKEEISSQMKIKFSVSNPIVPYETGDGADGRLLGIAFYEMEIE